MIGRDSPGVGAYAYDFVHLSQSVLGNKRKIAEIKIGTEEKFHELTSVKNFKEKYVKIFTNFMSFIDLTIIMWTIRLRGLRTLDQGPCPRTTVLSTDQSIAD